MAAYGETEKEECRHEKRGNRFQWMKYFFWWTQTYQWYRWSQIYIQSDFSPSTCLRKKIQRIQERIPLQLFLFWSSRIFPRGVACHDHAILVATSRQLRHLRYLLPWWNSWLDKRKIEEGQILLNFYVHCNRTRNKAQTQQQQQQHNAALHLVRIETWRLASRITRIRYSMMYQYSHSIV